MHMHLSELPPWVSADAFLEHLDEEEAFEHHDHVTALAHSGVRTREHSSQLARTRPNHADIH
jgi:hypothetical protein